MQYPHLVTNIPPGSFVRVFARGAFCNWKEPMRGNALVIVATANAYPIRVSVSPIINATHEKGSFNVRTPMGGSCITSYTQTGERIDFTIKNVFEYNPTGQEHYYQDRAGHAWVEVKQANAPRSDKTDIVERIICQKCQAEIPSGQGTLCIKCDVKRSSCDEATGEGWPPIRCGAGLYMNYGMCKRHALKAGLLKRPSRATVRRPRGRPKKNAASLESQNATATSH